MIDISNLSYDELQDLKRQIANVEKDKIQTFEFTFKVDVKCTRDDDFADIVSFSDHIVDEVENWLGFSPSPTQRIYDVSYRIIK
jgi:hypothetical protein